MNADQIGGIVRAIVAFGGGFLVAKGLIDAATLATIGGAIATAVAAYWSYRTNKSGKVIQ